MHLLIKRNRYVLVLIQQNLNGFVHEIKKIHKKNENQNNFFSTIRSINCIFFSSIFILILILIHFVNNRASMFRAS